MEPSWGALALAMDPPREAYPADTRYLVGQGRAGVNANFFRGDNSPDKKPVREFHQFNLIGIF
ncbi:MAG: hypothetical protein VW338_07720 [Rhodospirillaceae bacterium]